MGSVHNRWELATDAMHLEWPALERELHQRLHSPAAMARADDEALFDAEGTFALEDCRARLEALDELEGLLRGAADLQLARLLSQVAPVAQTLALAQRGVVLQVVDLLAIADGLQAQVAIAELLERDDEQGRHPRLRAVLGALDPPRPLAARLARAIDRDAGGGAPGLADAASPTLAALRERVRSLRSSLRIAAERLLRKPGLATAFGDGYVTERDGRVVLPVRSSAFSTSGTPGTVAGIIHDASQTGQTLFVEPHALVDENNALRSAQVAVRTEEQRVLAELSDAVAREAERIAGGTLAMVRLDVVHARLLLSTALHGHAPQLVAPEPGARLHLPNARHPIMLLRGREVVPNDLHIDVGAALVISGPNAGGKTVALKTLGLCVLLGRVGVRLPTAPGAVLPMFRALVTDVGDDQSIAQNLSTFSAHVGHVRRACETVRDDGAGTLVLLDEVAVGTDPEQGAALAESVVRDLVEHGATVVVTTHYERLKLLAHDEPSRYVNAAVGFELATLRSTFRIHVGIPGNSSALAVARRLGLPEEVLARAADLLDGARVQVDALLAEIAEARERLAVREAELEREQAAATAARLRLEALARDEEQRASAKLARAHAAAAAELRGLQVELRDARKALKKDPSAAIDDAGALARRADRDVDARRPDAPPVPGAPPPVLAPGDRVRIESMGVEGEVVAIKGERVVVQLPNLRTTVDRDELRPPGPRERARAHPPGPRPVANDRAARHFGADARPVDPGLDDVVDLRGARVDEAIPLLETFLARAIEDDREVIVVRHGHGSGALRKLVREHLPHLRHVVRHRAGLPDEGGDAVTVVWVRG